MDTIKIELTERNLLDIVPEIIDECYNYIDAHNKCRLVDIILDDITWGELEEITPYTNFRPSYDFIMSKDIKSEDDGIVFIDYNKVVLKPWKNVNRFFRVLSFRCNFNDWYNL